MGTLSEYYRYLRTKPEKLNEFYDTVSHITITEELKSERRKLKLWKDNDIEEVCQQNLFSIF